MTRFVFFLLLTFSVHTAFSQVPVEQCGYRYEVERILQRQPNFFIWQDAYYQAAMDKYMDLQSDKRDIIVQDTEYYEIPVVFHILYNNANENIHDSLIYNQIEELNRSFRKQTSDTNRIRAMFKPIAADVRIQFKLANIDPMGNPTSGINRKYTTKTTFARNIYGAYTTDMKSVNNGGAAAWDPVRYLNIWVCNMEFPNYLAIVYGFATPPTGAPNWDNTGNVTKDSNDNETGVVLHYKVTGVNSPLSPSKYKEGKTAVHEVGHYLGLRHTWGDGSSVTGCSVDDGIFDTPNSRYSNSSCLGQNTCNDGAGDLPDQTENYMDYALDGCAAMFTKQQAFMMRYVLNTFRTALPYRSITSDTIKPSDGSRIVSLYPNPVNDNAKLNLNIQEDVAATYAVSIIDACGRQIISRNFKSNQVFEIDLSGMAGALYFVIIKDSAGVVISKEKIQVR